MSGWRVIRPKQGHPRKLAMHLEVVPKDGVPRGKKLR